MASHSGTSTLSPWQFHTSHMPYAPRCPAVLVTRRDACGVHVWRKRREIMGNDAVAVRPRLRKGRQARPKPTGWYARLLRRAAGTSAIATQSKATVHYAKEGSRGAWVRPAPAHSQKVIVKTKILRQGHTGHRSLAATTK